MTWQEYVLRVAGNDPQDLVAREVGVSASTISRWRAGKTTPRVPAEAALFATAYGENVLEAFVAAGYLTPEQASMPPAARPDVGKLSNEELATEVARRLRVDFAVPDVDVVVEMKPRERTYPEVLPKSARADEDEKGHEDA